MEGIDKQTTQLIEALLFLENGPVNLKHLTRTTGLDRESVRLALSQVSDRLRNSDSALMLIENDKGDYQLNVKPDLYEKLGEHYDKRRKLNLSPQALETLAIIAYKQPITRPEIERIRGVAVGHVLRLLVEHELIRISGRKEVAGRPALYATTKKFLNFFGLLSLRDLPPIDEFER
jgi:segregation and condensation protein B